LFSAFSQGELKGSVFYFANKTVIVTAGIRGGRLALSKKYEDNVVMVAEKDAEIAAHPFLVMLLRLNTISDGFPRNSSHDH